MAEEFRKQEGEDDSADGSPRPTRGSSFWGISFVGSEGRDFSDSQDNRELRLKFEGWGWGGHSEEQD